MFSRFRKNAKRKVLSGQWRIGFAVLVLSAVAAAQQPNLSKVDTAGHRVLKVCADPEAMPSSNRRAQGYDNKIAELIARDMHATLVLNWQRNGRGFVRDILNKGVCDVVMGVPAGVRAMLTTQPYYRSTYVFVTRRDRDLELHTFQDPELKKLKIGVQVLEEEYAPPGQALGRHGLVTNIVGYDTTERPASIMNAVYRKNVDTAIVWGPLAGYFAKQYPGRFEITATPPADPPVPMAFSIALGVSTKHPELRDDLNHAISRRKRDIERILRSYGVPLLPEGGAR
jgi:mxaJ protein